MSAFKNSAWQIVIGLVVLVAAVVGVVVLVGQTQNSPVIATSAPRGTPLATSPAVPQDGAPAAPGAEPAPAGAPGVANNDSCTNFTGEMESPTKMEIERLDVDSTMMVVGDDAAGNPGAPPKNESHTTAWYNRSPAPGTTQGNVILTIHTYSPGLSKALGNELYSDKGLKSGDLIKISDKDGNRVCYRYRENTKVWVDDYDPASGVFHNLEGKPQLAIMICWDYDKKRQPDNWASRIIFYADLIPEGAPV